MSLKVLQYTKAQGLPARPMQWRQLAWTSADGATWLQAHGLTCIHTLLGAHLHAWCWAGLHALGAALGAALLHARNRALRRALGGTGLDAGIDACRGTDIHTLSGALGAARLHTLGDTLGATLSAARLHALGDTLGAALSAARLHTLGDTLSAARLHTLRDALSAALGAAGLHTLGAAARGALRGTGVLADLHTLCWARLHADVAAGLHTLAAFLQADGRGQAGLLALLVVRHPAGYWEAKTRQTNQDSFLPKPQFTTKALQAGIIVSWWTEKSARENFTFDFWIWVHTTNTFLGTWKHNCQKNHNHKLRTAAHSLALP